MSKDEQRLLKAVGKFRKNAERERERVVSLERKSEKLKTRREPSSAVDRFFERLRQKELQANGEIAWADQVLSELDAREPRKKKTAKKVAEAVGVK